MTFRDIDVLRNQMNRLLTDFTGGGVGFGRRGGFGGGGFGGGLFDEDLFDFGMPSFYDVGFPSIGAGFPVGLGMGPSQGQFGQGQLKAPEETKQMDVDIQGGQPQISGAGTQLQTTPQAGNLMSTFRPSNWVRARVNVEEQPEKYIVTAELPGFDKQNIKVNLSDDGLLTIKGEQSKEWVDQSKDRRYLRAERSFSNVQRNLRLPKHVDATKISASYDNGILHVNLPKAQEAIEKKTDIQIQ